MNNKTASFPFRSSEAYTRAAELLVRGAWFVTEPQDKANAKPEGYQVEELLWEIGRSQTLRINEIQDAHDAIPDALAPRKDTTSDQKTSLANRVRVLLAHLASAEAALSGLREGVKCFECDADLTTICLVCNELASSASTDADRLKSTSPNSQHREG